MKIFLEISYLGSAYCGYQVQPNGDTVQGRLNAAARELFGFECDVVGCSRTDSGVHANTFCATLSKRGEAGIECPISESAIPFALNARLPDDIVVKSAKFVPCEFHPRYDVKKKEYIYKIYANKLPDPFLHGRVWHYPRGIEPEAVTKMNEAAKHFVGRHDFSAFMASGSSVATTEREVFEAEVKKEGDLVVFRVSADGFLYNMVRIMTGTLIGVAEGKYSPDVIPEIITSKDRKRAGQTAPPEGLYLNRVYY